VPGENGDLCIVRSLAGEQQALHQLRQRILMLWLAGLLAAILCTYGVAQRIMGPVATLDRAASEIGKGNYHVHIEQTTNDELGRLAKTFNTMCASLENARAELIRHERLTAVARLATFVVHDLRNPLASIYAGSEMLVDNDLPPRQVKRLAKNMYRASRGVMEILQELLTAARNEPREVAVCPLSDIVMTAWQGLSLRSEAAEVQFDCNVPPALELAVDRAPMERVFHNLFENALEAMDGRGTIRVSADIADDSVSVHVWDTGRGIHPDLRRSLFQPFATRGKTGGLGLGLALSRQTVIANGGDLWADFHCTSGSHFVVRLPLRSKEHSGDINQSAGLATPLESFPDEVEAPTKPE
jgi:signal transduction histidine kinase